MAANKKYYYLKLKDNYFDSDEIIILESMADGYKYSNILLKLYLRSLKQDGKLMFNDRIPFNSAMLAQVTRHSVGDVEKALKIFQELNLIEILDNGAIYMMDIQTFIGESSTEADRKRAYRERIKQEKQPLLTDVGQTSDKCPDKSPPEIRDRDRDRVKDKDNKRCKFASDFDNPIFKLTKSLTNKMLKNNPKAKVPEPETAKFEKWCTEIDKMNRIDHYTFDEIEAIIEYSQTNAFWSSNILSTRKLREKAGTLKIQMAKNQKPKSAKDRLEMMKNW